MCTSIREIYNRQVLPDKAIDILDEAGARSHMFNDKVPKNIISIEKQIESLRSKKKLKLQNRNLKKQQFLETKKGLS